MTSSFNSQRFDIVSFIGALIAESSIRLDSFSINAFKSEIAFFLLSYDEKFFSILDSKYSELII